MDIVVHLNHSVVGFDLYIAILVSSFIYCDRKE